MEADPESTPPPDQTEQPDEEGQKEPDPKWPIRDDVNRLRSYDRGDLRGENRLGALAFNDAPGQLDEIIDVLDDLSLEDWSELDPTLTGNVVNNLAAVLQTLEQMLEADSSNPDIQNLKPQLEQQLAGLRDFFKFQVRPHAIDARVGRAVNRLRDPGQMPAEGDVQAAGAQRAAETMRALEDQLAQLQVRNRELASELDARAALVEAARDTASASGASELAESYEKQAKLHEEAWKRWGVGLIVALLVAAIGGLVLLLATKPPDDASNSQIVSHVAIDVLVVGLLIYAVRITSHQFSVHRHLEAVARNKAAALSTFTRIVSAGSEVETRTAVASVLAQSVFVSDETGFIDASGSQVTLIERLGAPVMQRMNPPTS